MVAKTKKVITKKATVKKAVAKKITPKKSPIKKIVKKQPKPTTKKKSKFIIKHTESVTFKIHRLKIADGKQEKRVDTFTVPCDDSTTVLQALEYIKGNADGTLTYRRSCRASICGSCGMFINNRSRLACKTKVFDLINGGWEKDIRPSKVIEIAPQKNQKILKDLVVDLDDFYSKVKKIIPYVQTGNETELQVNKQSFEQVNMVSNCIMCGVCYSDCTAMDQNPNFIGPAALAKAFRFIADPREGHKTERLTELSKVNGIWDCARCAMCVDSCPKGVAPMEAIVKLRTRAINAKVTGNAGARHALAFKGDIARWGLLNEPLLVLKTLGFRVFTQLGNILNIAKQNKVPSFIPHKAENLHEIQAIYDELEKNPIEVETRAEDTGPGAG